MFLPTDAPNLNFIDRYWKYLEKIVPYNSYYENFQKFKLACDNLFGNTEKHLSSSRTLLIDNYQIIDKCEGSS